MSVRYGMHCNYPEYNHNHPIMSLFGQFPSYSTGKKKICSSLYTAKKLGKFWSYLDWFCIIYCVLVPYYLLTPPSHDKSNDDPSGRCNGQGLVNGDTASLLSSTRIVLIRPLSIHQSHSAKQTSGQKKTGVLVSAIGGGMAGVISLRHRRPLLSGKTPSNAFSKHSSTWKQFFIEIT